MNKEIKIVKFEGSDPGTTKTINSKTIEHQTKEIEYTEGSDRWDSVFEYAGTFLGGILNGITNNDNALTQEEIAELERQQNSQISFGTIFLYGGAAIIVLVLAYILIKRRS